jgi:hypothetical protein
MSLMTCNIAEQRRKGLLPDISAAAPDEDSHSSTCFFRRRRLDSAVNQRLADAGRSKYRLLHRFPLLLGKQQSLPVQEGVKTGVPVEFHLARRCELGAIWQHCCRNITIHLAILLRALVLTFSSRRDIIDDQCLPFHVVDKIYLVLIVELLSLLGDGTNSTKIASGQISNYLYLANFSVSFMRTMHVSRERQVYSCVV